METRHKRRLLITGCGRSGTRYVVALLAKHGLDVRHEKVGQDGVASWCMAVDAEETPWGPPRRNFDFDHIFQQVRSPLTAIPSIALFKQSSWRYIERWCPCSANDPPILKSAVYWLCWNEHAEKISDWRYRIEDFRDIYPEFCNRIGVNPSQEILDELPSDINTRSKGRILHLYDEICLGLGLYPKASVRGVLSTLKQSGKEPQSVTWDEISSLDAALCDRIREKAKEYGYLQ